MRIGVIGLGLIGGSMARAFSARTPHTVWGRDTDPATMSAARACGAIDEELTDERVGQCDLVLLALTPAVLPGVAAQIAPLMRAGALLVDLCGVKRVIEQAVCPLAARYGFIYVGGHPMAGKERGGFSNATASLYDGASMILVPPVGTPGEAIKTLDGLFCSIGFRMVVTTDADTHDHHIAYTSQLAHVVSSAYIRSPQALLHTGFSAGSFKDMTRVATLDEQMWTSLFLANRDHLSAELDGLITRLQEYADAIKRNDPQALCAALRAGREQKAASLEGETPTCRS